LEFIWLYCWVIFPLQVVVIYTYCAFSIWHQTHELLLKIHQEKNQHTPKLWQQWINNHISNKEGCYKGILKGSVIIAKCLSNYMTHKYTRKYYNNNKEGLYKRLLGIPYKCLTKYTSQINTKTINNKVSNISAVVKGISQDCLTSVWRKSWAIKPLGYCSNKHRFRTAIKRDITCYASFQMLCYATVFFKSKLQPSKQWSNQSISSPFSAPISCINITQY